MGRFEDLLKQAKEGDAAALDALETEFSGSTLREKAESAESLQKKLADSLPLIRKAKLSDLTEQLEDDLKAAGLNADDFKDVDPDDLTLDMVKDKAKSKLDAAQESRTALAKESGFDTVEEFDAALALAKQAAEKKVANMETIGAGAASSGGQPSGQGGEEADVTKDAFEKAKKEGKSDDVALGMSIDALLESQMQEATEES